MVGEMHSDKTVLFIKKAIKVHGDQYDYTKVDYVSAHIKVIIGCSIHGDFEQRPNNHLTGNGCTKCGRGRKDLSHTSTTSTFVEYSMEVHGDLYDYSEVDYTHNKVKVIITCRLHGSFRQTPSSHLQGCGCPKCANYGFSKDKPGILYYLRVGNTYKIGVTNLTVNKRFNSTDLTQIEVVETINYDNGVDCYNKEQEILKKYKGHKYIGPDLLTSGNTELFNLNLVDHYGVTTILDL